MMDRSTQQNYRSIVHRKSSTETLVLEPKKFFTESKGVNCIALLHLELYFAAFCCLTRSAVIGLCGFLAPWTTF